MENGVEAKEKRKQYRLIEDRVFLYNIYDHKPVI